MEWHRVQETLRRDFGRPAFLPHQQGIIERVLAGVDTLGILPTGSGKSLTYQLPAMLLPGVTLVVSPLIALMKDQVDAAPAAIRDRVAYLSADQTLEQQRRTLDGVRDGRVKLLYVAPERLPYRSLRAAVQQAGVGLFVVDEAHCVSFWGNDFRPVYRLLARAHTGYGRPTVLALTSTAPHDVVEDIVSALGRHLDIVRESVDRPNLYLAVETLPNADARLQRTIELCRTTEGAGVVFVPSRVMAGQVAAALREAGVKAAPYHAGLAREARDANQHAFMTGAVRVMVATVAFGMGIDKADVRFVLHAGPPSAAASYAQEIGRAGRDGQPARCVLLTTPGDRKALPARVDGDVPTAPLLERVLGLVAQGRDRGWAPVDFDRLARDLQPGTGEPVIDPEVALGYLTQARALERTLDAPREFTLTRRTVYGAGADMGDDGERLWQHVAALLEPDWSARGQAWLDPIAACEQLGIDPGRLYALMWERPEVRFDTPVRHVAWYRLTGMAPGDRSRHIADLVDKVRWQRQERVAQMFRYVDAGECRHVALGRVFDERLPPCRTQCDVCRPAQAPPPPRADRPPVAEPARRRMEPPPPAPPPPPADPLYDRLVQWRKERAARDRMQASAIATTQQLEAIARARPATAADLRRLAGMPAGWVDRYGAEVLALVTGRA